MDYDMRLLHELNRSGKVIQVSFKAPVRSTSKLKVIKSDLSIIFPQISKLEAFD